MKRKVIGQVKKECLYSLTKIFHTECMVYLRTPVSNRADYIKKIEIIMIMMGHYQ